MVYVTSSGIKLSIDRVDRKLIDDLIARFPIPEPPMREVEVWEGIEEIPDHKDPDYQAAMRVYHVQLGMAQFDVIHSAITTPNFHLDSLDFSELATLGFTNSYQAWLLQEALPDAKDLAAVVAEVFYQSTVTHRGVEEAEQRFAVTFMDKPVSAWTLPGSSAKRSQMFLDWQAAVFAGYTWEGFCELTGPQQSGHVAYYLIINRLNWLMEKYK